MTESDTKLTNIRFDNEVVPFDVAIKGAWIDKCDPALLPAVEKDYDAIRAMHFGNAVPAADGEQKLYVATAGSPCSGKSTELDFLLEETDDPRIQTAVLVDPDRFVMEFMNYTYRPLMGAGEIAKRGFVEAAKNGYETARPGSNIISNLLFNEAFDAGYHIVHGTTMTSPFVGGMLDTLAANGYQRRLYLCYSEEEVRADAGCKRLEQEGLAHGHPDHEDFAAKGKLFPQRMAEYFKHGDELVLMWKDDVAQRAVRAAEYTDGRLHIVDERAFTAFKDRYDAQRATLAAEDQITLPAWDEMEATYAARFAPDQGADNTATPDAPHSGPEPS